VDQTTEQFVSIFITFIDEFNYFSNGCDAYCASELNVHLLWFKGSYWLYITVLIFAF
jgi:hypothetical protein